LSLDARCDLVVDLAASGSEFLLAADVVVFLTAQFRLHFAADVLGNLGGGGSMHFNRVPAVRASNRVGHGVLQ